MALSKNAKRWLIIGGIILVILMSFSSCKRMYNTMVEFQETIDEHWAKIEVNLKRRYNLIPNFVKTVKRYAKHEKELFTQIAESRAKLAGGGGTTATRAKAAAGMESAIGRLLMIVERYPDLKASANFRALQDELAGSENRIAVARNRYNEAVKNYNAHIRKFPTNIMAGMFNFTKAVYFKAEEAAKEVPKVDFE